MSTLVDFQKVIEAGNLENQNLDRKVIANAISEAIQNFHGYAVPMGVSTSGNRPLSKDDEKRKAIIADFVHREKKLCAAKCAMEKLSDDEILTSYGIDVRKWVADIEYAIKENTKDKHIFITDHVAPIGRPKYDGFRAFASDLYRTYLRFGGSRKYTKNPVDSSLSGEAIAFVLAVIEQIKPFIPENAIPPDPTRTISKAIDEVCKGNKAQ